MKFYRFKDDAYKAIEEVRLDQLDLKERRTLFIFPGFDNRVPKKPYPPAGEPDLTTYGKMSHSLPRGVVFAQQAQGDDEPFQVVMATWDNPVELLRQRKAFVEHPAKFAGREAQEFIHGLYEQGFDPNRVSFLGWSYGSAFIQQCANAIHTEPELEEKRTEGDKSKSTANGLPPIYAATTATVTNLGNNSVNGFPGFYMYAKNDKILEEYVGDEQRTLYSNILGSGRPVGVIKTDGREDHVMAIVTTAEKGRRQRMLPANARMMKRPANRRQWYSTPPELYEDPDRHGPPLFMDMIDDRHPRYFKRAFANILARKKPISFEEMLFNTENIHTDDLPAAQKYTAVLNLARTHKKTRLVKQVRLSDEIKNLLSRFSTEVDSEGLMLTSELIGTPNLTWERDPEMSLPMLEKDQEYFSALERRVKHYEGKAGHFEAKFGKKHGMEIMDLTEHLKEHAVMADLTEEQARTLMETGELEIRGSFVKREITRLEPGMYRVHSWFSHNNPDKPKDPEEQELKKEVEWWQEKIRQYGEGRKPKGKPGADEEPRRWLPDALPPDDDVGRG